MSSVSAVYALAVSLLTGLLFGLGAGLRSPPRTGATEHSKLQQPAQHRAAAAESSRLWPKALVTAQIMLSLLSTGRRWPFPPHPAQSAELRITASSATICCSLDSTPRLAGYRPSQTPALHQQLHRASFRTSGSAAPSLSRPPGRLAGGQLGLQLRYFRLHASAQKKT